MAEAPKGFIIAAPSSGSGKTIAALGLLSALRKKGLRVAPAKAGPDYIDPGFHRLASGRASVNLDPWAMSPEMLCSVLSRAAAGADIIVIEGVMGLFDGAAGGAGSTADLAKALGLPVILVLDAAAQAQSAAAVAHGIRTFDPEVDVAGVIATRIAGVRHRALIEDALAKCAIPFFGAIGRDPALTVPSRHLGLVQATELAAIESVIEKAAEAVTAGVDLDHVQAAAKPVPQGGDAVPLPPLGQRIAVAQDRAFSFHYQHLIDGWQRASAEILPFSPLADEPPSAGADAVFLPGGYPELHAAALSEASAFRKGMLKAADDGALIYGECGGYMVLGESLADADGRTHPMLGLLSHSTSFAERKLSLGYRALKPNGKNAFKSELRGHEFHYSLKNVDGSDAPLFSAKDAVGKALGPMGGQRGNVMGSYAHIIAASR